MLTIISKEYEIEEEIECKNEKEETLYKFTMKITPDEVQKINQLIFDEKAIKKAEEYNRLLQDNKMEESNVLLEEIENISKNNQEEFESICFKEHREPFKTTCGEYKYNEMVEMMQGFFWNIFISKKNKQVNTMLTDLMKITQK
jgi:hypothetical protein